MTPSLPARESLKREDKQFEPIVPLARGRRGHYGPYARRADRIGKNGLRAGLVGVRKEAGLTQADVAVALSVAASTVTKWERGGVPLEKYLDPLASVLGITRARLEHLLDQPLCFG